MLVYLSLRVHDVSSFIILGELVTAQLVVPEIFKVHKVCYPLLLGPPRRGCSGRWAKRCRFSAQLVVTARRIILECCPHNRRALLIVNICNLGIQSYQKYPEIQQSLLLMCEYVFFQTNPKKKNQVWAAGFGEGTCAIKSPTQTMHDFRGKSF